MKFKQYLLMAPVFFFIIRLADILFGWGRWDGIPHSFVMIAGVYTAAIIYIYWPAKKREKSNG